MWDELLGRGYRVIAFDQRGHGRSTIGSAGIGSETMAADDAAVLDHFDVHDGVLVGHSMGGFVAIRAVLDHPEIPQRLRVLVLFATWAGRILDGAPQNRLQIPLLEYGIFQRLMRTRTGGVLLGAHGRQAPVTGDDRGGRRHVPPAEPRAAAADPARLHA